MTDPSKYGQGHRPGDAVASGQRPRPVSLILYLPFGIVRGQMVADSPEGVIAQLSGGAGMVEISQAVVEHYSNHLPTGNYDRLFIGVAQLTGFSVIEQP
ncbi:MAG: hypothetical protein U0Z53_04700 [Blastocatellia bacterium]